MKTGYSIRTWRMRLVCPEPIWLDRTEEYFQNVVEFYYHLLRQHEELWNSSLFDIQRSLELMTLTGRDGRQPTNPLPMGKVPVYLRRAAINKASATVKSTQELQSGFPEKLEAKVTFFKGMYSDLTDRSICLKLWNGEKWIWTDCELKGRPFPQDGQLMSPTLVSYSELLRICLSTVITFLFQIIGITFAIQRMPMSYYLFGTIIQFCLITGIRFSYRFVLLERTRKQKEEEGPLHHIMLIGAGQAGQIILRDVERAKEPKGKVCCIIDDNPNKWGRYMESVPIVGGRDDILASAKKYKIDQILLAIPSASAAERRDSLKD